MKWFKEFSWENLFDGIAAKSPDFVKIIIVTGKSFLYYHGLTRAAALTYTSILAVVPLLILLTSITLAVGFGNFISDYLPHLLDMFSLDWPTEPIVALIENAEHVPLAKLGFIGAAGLFVTFILAFGSLESNFNVIWENKTSRTLLHQTSIYTPFLLILASFIGLYAGFVNHVQQMLSTIIIDGFHFSPSFLNLLINAFWYITFNIILLLFIFLMLYALPSRPEKKPAEKTYTKRKLFWSSILATALAWVSIIIYVKILMLIQTAMVNRMSIFYGSLAFIPLVLFLVFGIWVIILCGNSLVWTICHWPEAREKTWNWQGASKDL